MHTVIYIRDLAQVGRKPPDAHDIDQVGTIPFATLTLHVISLRTFVIHW
jgi:hypothetical protein